MENTIVTSFNIGKLRFDLDDIYSLPRDHPYAGQIAEIPMHCFHIALPGRSLLVDAVACEPKEIPDSLQVSGYVPPPPLLEQLKAKGIDSEEVSDVIITHAHPDHYSALSKSIEGSYIPAFPQARHYLSMADWNPEGFWALPERTLMLVKQHGLLNLIEGVVDLGDGMTILPMPGETPGHQILYLQTEEQNIYFAGDLYHHPIELTEASQNVKWAALDEMEASKAALMKRAAEVGGLVYFTHISGSYRVVEGSDRTMEWQSAESE